MVLGKFLPDQILLANFILRLKINEYLWSKLVVKQRKNKQQQTNKQALYHFFKVIREYL